MTITGKLLIVGLGGSLRQPSSSLTALRVGLQGAEAAGAETHLLDIRALNLPMYEPSIQNAPVAAQEMCEIICQAHGMLWSSPLYHGTITGAFKNALDWLDLLADRQPPYLTNKVIGLISTAGGVQGLQAVNTMEFVVRALRGWAVPLVMPIPRAWQVFNAEGHIQDPKLAEQLQTLGQEVVRAARQMATSGTCDYAK